MDFKIVCGTWIKEDDEKILTILQESNRWLTAEELSEKTGLPLIKVHTTLKLLNQQRRFAERRKKFFEGFNSDC